MKRLLFILPVLIANVVFGQYDPLSPPNTFRSSDNPLYWNNRPPSSDYWQQDVHYIISAELDVETDVITGKQRLIYWNNSPDTLTHLFFHLYQNAYTPNSFLGKLREEKGEHTEYGGYESEGLGTEVLSFKVDGKDIQPTLDGTIMHVPLENALLANSKVTIDIDFKTYFDNGGSSGKRMKKFEHAGSKHYDAVHWYPRISVYDRKFGWTTDPHLGSEFYGDHGTFDVQVTTASNMILDGTGFLTNRDEVLPADLRKKLDITNFKDKPWGEKASVILPYDSDQTKTWKFHAENVHDFGFTVDPTYRIGEADALVDGRIVKCYSLAQEEHASKWQNAASFSAKIIELFSKRVGPYHYHKMIVADARDGMEYPMLTLDGGSDPGYRDLLVHEIGHNWFYGMVGNNETYRAGLDEGFTQYLTVMGMQELQGDTDVFEVPDHWYKRLFKKPVPTLDNQIYNGFMRSGKSREVPAIDVHSDHYHEGYIHGYGHVYYKAGVMLFNLEYVLGDELFATVMKTYFDRWKFGHPYWDDFRQVVRDVTKSDMNWFFDQWIGKTEHIDYSIASVYSLKNDRYQIKIKRKENMQMPLDIKVVTNSDSIINYYIPNTYFQKKTDATVLPQWKGWGKKNRSYEFIIELQDGLKSVQIDTSRRLADVYMLDNSRGVNRSKFEFDSQIKNRSERDKYEIRIRPDFWYNGYDGVKAGGSISGDYLKTHHVFNFKLWVNTGAGQWGFPKSVSGTDYQFMSVMLDYKTSMARFWKRSDFVFSGRVLDGLYHYDVGVQKFSKNRKTKYSFYYRSLYRYKDADLAYLLVRDGWNSGEFNNTINIDVKHDFSHKHGHGSIAANLRGSGPGSDYGYGRIQVEFKDEVGLGKLKLKSRIFGQIGTGNTAPESALYLDRASPEEMMFNKYTRSAGIIPESWATYDGRLGHYHHGGGLNLRGYSSYVAPQLDDQGNVQLTYQGTTGAAVNIELEFDDLFGFKPKFARNWLDIDLYLFADAGIINMKGKGDYVMATPRADAGIGTSITIKKWGLLEKVKPLTIRFDMPIYLSHAPALAPNNFQFNWLLGIGRAF